MAQFLLATPGYSTESPVVFELLVCGPRRHVSIMLQCATYGSKCCQVFRVHVGGIMHPGLTLQLMVKCNIL
jgi:hypothetical protein